MSVKKSVTAMKSGVKKARPSPTHPSWVEMIKECIDANREDARIGVSRPQIKKFVEEKYKLTIDNAQLTHLSKAIANGAEKGLFVLPKGPSGRVKLPPKTTKATDTPALKENKPAKTALKPAQKLATKARPSKIASTKATKVKAITPKKSGVKAKTATAVKAPVSKKPAAPIKAKAMPAVKKTLAGKKIAPVKKAASLSRRGTAKKAITGTSASAKAKTAAIKKTTAKKPVATSTTNRKKTTKK